VSLGLAARLSLTPEGQASRQPEQSARHDRHVANRGRPSPVWSWSSPSLRVGDWLVVAGVATDAPAGRGPGRRPTLPAGPGAWRGQPRWPTAPPPPRPPMRRCAPTRHPPRRPAGGS